MPNADLVRAIARTNNNFPSTAISINDVADTEVTYYKGVFEVELEDGSTWYIKTSDGLGRPFSFETEESCQQHLSLYERLRDVGFYHPNSRFVASENKDSYRIISATPDMASVTHKKNQLVHFPEDQYIKQRDLLFSIIDRELLNGDVVAGRNYGVDNGKLYYFDMHIFKEVPSPMFE